MTPASAIDMLDRFLAENGEDVILRRLVGLGPESTDEDIPVRAHVRGLREDELIAGATQDDRMLIMSPTEITAANWPGGVFSLPSANDKAVVADVVCNAEFVNAIRMAGQVVRIEMRVRG